MQDSMRILPPTEGNQIRPIPSLDLSSPEVHITPRLERAADLSVNATDLGYAIDALADGAYVGDYIHNGRKIDLVIYGADDYLRHTQDLTHLPISTPSGELVPVDAVANVKVTSGPEQVNHSQRLRTITIQVKPQPLLALETAMEMIETEIRQPLLQEADFGSGGYRVRMAGTADKLNDTRRAMQWNLLLAAAITYLLMAALFESFFYPTVIMTSVALGMVGGVAGLALLNVFTPQALDTLTMLGFIILIGTVVNNPILIVHQSLVHMREEGMNETDAIVAASTNRIRPIMMTTVTTVLGMLPLVLPGPTFPDGFAAWWQGNGRMELAVGAGSELYRGLGAVILGGLILSTAFTLILTPVGFSLALDIKRGFMRLLGYHSSEDQQPPVHRTHPELLPDREHALGG
jgi:HAE1 family hydrophobic/amphiphilic exporter-1